MTEEKVALCINCRKQFTEADISNARACPSCGSHGVPADPRKTMTATLTTHEWRLLGIWANNWGEKHAEGNNPIEGIVNEIRRQNPDAPPLTMGEELAGVKSAFPEAKITDADGNKLYETH